MNVRRFVWLIVFVIAIGLVFILANLTGVDNSAQLASYTPASVESQLRHGEPIYAQTCATSTCHGTQGEGIRSGAGFSAWPLVGAEFQSRHPNAQIVFDVIRSGGYPTDTPKSGLNHGNPKEPLFFGDSLHYA